MVSLVLLSHSAKVVEGIKDIAKEMVQNAPIFVAGGDLDGGLGSNYALIKETLQKAYNPDGVVVLYDMGSTIMTAELILDELKDEEMKSKIKISKAPLFEGAIAGAMEIIMGASLEEVLTALKDIEIEK